MENRNDPIHFVIPGDLHLTKAGLANHETALWAVKEVNHLIQPDFVMFIGDNVQHARQEEFALFRSVTGALTVPFHALVGDHDVHKDPNACGFRAKVGETYGAFSLRGFRFIRLNTQEAKPVGLMPEQVQWFRGEVDNALASGERVVIFQHNYPYQIWEDFAGPGVDAWREIVQTRRITAILSGHTHYGQIANDGRNVCIATRSIGDPEGGPAGYTLGYLHDEDFAVTYRSVEDHGPLVLITHPREQLLAIGPRHIVSKVDQIRVRTWSATQIKTAQVRIDQDSRVNLNQAGPNLWEYPLPGDQLTKGTHSVAVQVVNAKGLKGEQQIRFVVDPTGRYTAIPSVRPEVTETAFC